MTPTPMVQVGEFEGNREGSLQGLTFPIHLLRHFCSRIRVYCLATMHSITDRCMEGQTDGKTDGETERQKDDYHANSRSFCVQYDRLTRSF